MRIVAGRHRGRSLVAPEGLAVRPTSDRAREALFDVLASGRLSGDESALIEAVVLDSFAGSGALGLEALSRGAAHAVFMENHAPALAALERNIANLDEGERTEVLRRGSPGHRAATWCCSTRPTTRAWRHRRWPPWQEPVGSRRARSAASS